MRVKKTIDVPSDDSNIDSPDCGGYDSPGTLDLEELKVIITITIIILLCVVCSGFWGLLCVGIFSRTCLILEVYEELCYCVTNDLPSVVCRRAAVTDMIDYYVVQVYKYHFIFHISFHIRISAS